MLRLDRVDRVVDRALDHSHVDLGAGGAPPAGPGSAISVFTAIAFHSVRALAAGIARVGAGTVLISPANAMTAASETRMELHC